MKQQDSCKWENWSISLISPARSWYLFTLHLLHFLMPRYRNFYQDPFITVLVHKCGIKAVMNEICTVIISNFHWASLFVIGVYMFPCLSTAIFVEHYNWFPQTRVNSKEVLKERIPNISIKKRQLKFLWYIIRKEGLENITLTGYIEGKRDKWRQRGIYLTSLCE